MCEITTLSMIAMGASLAGTAMGAAGAGARGRAARFTANLNASMTERQAADAVERAMLPGSRVRMQGGKMIGVQEAHYAAAGVAVGVGSAGDVTKETRIITDREEQRIRNDAAREAHGLRTKAQAYRQQGEYAAAEADSAVLNSIIGGVGKMAAIGAKGWLDVPSGEGAPTVPTIPMVGGDFPILSPEEMYS